MEYLIPEQEFARYDQTPEEVRQAAHPDQAEVDQEWVHEQERQANGHAPTMSREAWERAMWPYRHRRFYPGQVIVIPGDAA